MRAARSSPLYPGYEAGVVTPNADPELTQALQTLRSLQDVRGRQIATQGSRQRRSVPVVTRVVTAVLPTPPPTDPTMIRDRVITSLENLGQLPAELTIRQDGRAIVLEGAVESEARRAVVEQLIRLEPGVYEVENRLRVESRE
jgi:osmotically-inducible protein OsmY